MAERQVGDDGVVLAGLRDLGLVRKEGDRRPERVVVRYHHRLGVDVKVIQAPLGTFCRESN